MLIHQVLPRMTHTWNFHWSVRNHHRVQKMRFVFIEMEIGISILDGTKEWIFSQQEFLHDFFVHLENNFHTCAHHSIIHFFPKIHELRFLHF